MITKKIDLQKNKNWLKTFFLSSLLLIGFGCSQEDAVTTLDQEPTSVFNKSDNSVKLPISKITASTEQSQNPDSDAHDNDFNSRWSGQGIGATLDIDLGSVNAIDYINIAYFKGNERKAYFDYYYSTDGTNWTGGKSKTSGGNTTAFELFDLENSTGARYIRLVCNGNSSTNSSTALWNSILELEVYGTPGGTSNECTYDMSDTANIALGKPTSQTSTAHGGSSCRAVDGNTSGKYTDNSVTHTNNNNGNSWTVYLGDDYDLGNVVIWNRTDSCCKTRLSDFYVVTYNEAGVRTHWKRYQTIPDPSFTVNLTGVTASQLTIYDRSQNNDALSLAEVQIYEADNNGGGLDPNKSPAENFDLSQWKLTPSSGNDYSVAELNNNLEISNQFYTDNSDGGMVFKNYPKGAGTTTNSDYSRVEFREMLRGEEDLWNEQTQGGFPDTKGINKNNWVFSSSSASNETNSGGVGGKLTATLKVDRVTKTSTSSTQEGRIVIGQIHASGNEPCRLYYKLMDGDTKGAVYFIHEDSNGDEYALNMIGNYAKTGDPNNAGDYTGASQPSNGITLGEVFSYKIEVIGTMLYVDIYRDSGNISESYNMSNSGYANDWMYFKAGLYSQNKTVTSPTDYEQVTFYALENTH